MASTLRSSCLFSKSQWVLRAVAIRVGLVRVVEAEDSGRVFPSDLLEQIEIKIRLSRRIKHGEAPHGA